MEQHLFKKNGNVPKEFDAVGDGGQWILVVLSWIWISYFKLFNRFKDIHSSLPRS